MTSKTVNSDTEIYVRIDIDISRLNFSKMLLKQSIHIKIAENEDKLGALLTNYNGDALAVLVRHHGLLYGVP